MSLRVVGLGGSLMMPSVSLFALRTALAAAKAEGTEIEVLDLRTLGLPLYGSNGQRGCGIPPSASQLIRAVAEADAMIWSSPLYHGTVSGSFKNALDWLEELADRDPPFLTNKPVGLIATAAGVQGLQAINTMEFAVRALRGWAVPFAVPINAAHQAFDSDGTARDRDLADRLASLGSMVAAAARRFA